MLGFKDLVPDTNYLAIDKDGRKYEAVYCEDYGGVVFCVYPSFTSDGQPNDLIGYEEVNNG